MNVFTFTQPLMLDQALFSNNPYIVTDQLPVARAVSAAAANQGIIGNKQSPASFFHGNGYRAYLFLA